MKQVDDKYSRPVIEVQANERVILEGVDYWFRPLNDDQIRSQGLRIDIGSIASNNENALFYDYSSSLGLPDYREVFLEKLHNIETYVFPRWKLKVRAFYSDDYASVRRGLYDYLHIFLSEGKSRDILNFIDIYLTSDWHILRAEMMSHTIEVGKKNFNDIFYATLRMAAEELLSSDYINQIFIGMSLDRTRFVSLSRSDNAIVTHFDEAKELIFNTDLINGDFFVESWLKSERIWHCSSIDLKNKMIPYLIFLSGWNIPLGAYLAVSKYGSVGFQVLDGDLEAFFNRC